MYRDDLTALEAALEAAKRELAEQVTLRERAEEAARQAQLVASYVADRRGQRRVRLLLIALGAAALAGLALCALLVFRLGQSQRELRGLTQIVSGLRDERAKSMVALMGCQEQLGATHQRPRLELRCDDPSWAEPLYPLLGRFHSCMGRAWQLNATKPTHIVIVFDRESREKNQVLLRNANTEPGQPLCLLEVAQTLEQPAAARGTTLAFSLYP